MNKKDSMRYVYPLCFGEEVGNCITHGVMALLILFALPYYCVRAYLQGGAIKTFGTAVFLICLLGSLTLAHSQNSQMSFMYGFFFVKFLLYTVVCVVIVI